MATKPEKGAFAAKMSTLSVTSERKGKKDKSRGDALIIAISLLEGKIPRPEGLSVQSEFFLPVKVLARFSSLLPQFKDISVT